MQTLDVQHDMQQVNRTEAVQQGNNEKKPAAETGWKGTSFFELLQDLMAEEPDAGLVGAEVQDADLAEKTAHKKNAAMRTELARLKSKGSTQSGRLQSAEADGQKAEQTGLPVDMEAVFAAEEGIDVKNALESADGQLLKNMLTAQAESEAAAEAAAVSADGVGLMKRQKNGKQEAESAAGNVLASNASAVRLSGKLEKTAESTAAQDNPEKAGKIAQPKQHKPVFTIVDERTVHAAPVTADGSVHEAGAAVRVTDAPSIDMAADFRGMTASFNAAAGGTQASHESSAPSFASLVAQQVQDMAPDFVQAGRIVLQDNNAGIIRLQMQPAHLGNVRINLELASGKKIVGKIIAGSKEAYEAFKESIEQLSKAFEQGGFASAQFDISWSGEGGSPQSGEDNGQFNELFAKKSRVEVMQNNRYADTETVYAFGQDQAVNVFA